MIRLVLLGLFVASVALLVGAVALVKMFGWWSVPVLFVAFVGLAWGAKKLAGRALEAAFKMPFKAKGAVLRDAAAVVNSVTPGEPPARDPDGDDDDRSLPAGARRWVWLDVTITPNPPPGKFTAWAPGELMLVPTTAKADDYDDEESHAVSDVEVWEEGAFVRDEGYKFQGERRVRLLVGLPPEMRAARFRYYFELFGNVQLG
jgi:hypothetical protein